MSNDFLREYTIPLLPGNAATVPQYVETPLEPQHAPTGIPTANFNRYFAPGKQEPGQYVPAPPQPSRAPKRKYDMLNSDDNTKYFIGRDPSYPQELNDLIKPLYCELCSVKMNSPKSAKDHYQSKCHDKKLIAWVAHHYPENPPAIKRFVYEPREGEGGEEALYCKLCDLKLTSLVHAKQHYSGRKHKLVASNISNPKGAGYYDAEGKWIRTSTKNAPVAENDGRFGIGIGFKPTEVNENPESSATVENSQTETSKATSPNQPTNVNSPDESLCCKVCKISVTSAPQMKTHIEGARHRKNLARLSTDPNADPVTSTNTNISLLNVIKNSVTTPHSNEDYSMYRTPSGSYYCQVCNTSMSSVVALQQHIQGKKHMKIVADQKANDSRSAKAKAK